MNVVEQIIKKGTNWVNTAIENNWNLTNTPNLKKWAENKIAHLPFPLEEWDWEKDLKDFLIYVWLQYSPAKQLAIISSPDWCGGRQHYLFTAEGLTDPNLADFEYLEWKGTTRSLLGYNPSFEDKYCPQYEDSYTKECNGQDMFFECVFERIGIRPLYNK